MSVYCPRCGSLMVVADGWLTCTKEGIRVSPHLRGELERLVASDPVKPSASRLGRADEWHCPADGERLTFDTGFMQCRTCRRYLPDRLVYEVIEFNWLPTADRS